MDSNKNPPDNPAPKANIFSQLLFLWIIPLLCKGYKRTLNLNDLYNIQREDDTDYAGSQLKCLWKEEINKSKKSGKKPSLVTAIIQNSRRDSLIIISVYIFSQCVVSIGQMVVLRLLILSFEDNSHTKDWKPFIYAGIMSFLAFLNTILIHPTLFLLLRLGMRLRVAVSALIYQKCLRLSKSAQTLTNSGQIVNILSNDCTRFDISLNSLPYVITAPIQFGILLYQIYNQVGVAAFVGASLVVLLLPLQYFIGKYSAVFRSLVAEQTDQRGNIMNELIIGIKVIKHYVWEKLFANIVEKIRRSERKALQKRGYLRGVHIAVVNFSPKVVQYMTFLAFIYLNDGAFTADKVFFTNACLSTMIQVTVHFTPQAAAAIGELLVAIERIEKFLLLEEKVTLNEQQKQIHYKQPDLALSQGHTKTKPICVNVQLKDVRLKFSSKIILKDVSFSVGSNSLVIVVGPVGSSKSSLLHTILEELSISCGQLNKNGTVSYASQEPWVFAGTIRENILFGLPFAKERYSDVVHASALTDDFKQLPNGDMTLVGERGAALSGGQKARVNLARALYRDSDTYLLDDPLSAVDPRVSRHLFEKCVKGYLEHKLRILVTHQLQYLPEADYVIVLNDGSIISQGSYQQVLESGIEFVGFVNSSQSEEIIARRQSLLNEDQKIAALQRLELKCKEKQKTTTIPSEEAKSSGSVTLRTYYSYFISGHSLFAFIILLLVMILCQVFTSGSELWLSHWTNEEAKRTSPQTTDSEIFGPNTYYVYIYSAIIAAVIVTNMVRGIWFYTYCLKISSTIHEKMFSSLIQAPVRFFEGNPSGRILNRFTRDVGTLDELLPPALRDTIIILLQFIGVIAVVLVSNYYLAIPTAVLMIALYFLRKVFIATARDLKRIESVTRSPIYTHVAQTMSGMITIRSCGAEDNLIREFNSLQNAHTSAWFLFLAANRFFGIWLELISDTFLLIVSFSFLLISTSVNAGNVGLAISSILSMMVSLQWGMQQSAETENYMTSVERALEYGNLSSEETDSSEKSSPPPEWPDNGAIAFNQVTLKYNEGSPPVLKDLSFKIRPGEKIGIVGRTGAGKSSITAALFRLVEAEADGEIFIDGVEAREIPLSDWRSKISIIPQEPVLFSGTLRHNLDPFNEFTDMDLWGMINEVELKDAIHCLDSMVSNGGENFSVGQRQLICLARALLRKNKIVVLDEATANIDPKTDSLIQHCINSNCRNCTVIVIAHRLHSVIECDRVLVLEHGAVVEFDQPHKLLQNVDGNFAKMVSQTGYQTSSLLRKMALEMYERQHGIVQ